MYHSAALGMPARTTFAPRTIPTGLGRFCSFPQHKIKRVALGIVDLDAFTCAHVIKLPSGNYPVVVIASYRKIYIAVISHIGMTLINKYLNHDLHMFDFCSCTRANVGIQNPKAVHLLDKRTRICFCKLVCRNALLIGTIDDFVINIGKILSKYNSKAFVL
ncbi:Uncharacterised protein [Chlamydia trachomatis]|nr:Uncharacterised protein [Chlamydia trachomatis]